MSQKSLEYPDIVKFNENTEIVQFVARLFSKCLVVKVLMHELQCSQSRYMSDDLCYYTVVPY